MRGKRISIAMLAMVVAGTVVPHVEAAEARRAQVRYEMTDENHHVGVPGAGAGVWNTEDAYAFRLKKGEKFVSVDVVDDTEEPVAGVVVQIVWDYENGGAKVGHAETYEHFCGETERLVRVIPKVQVEIFLKKGTCQDGTPSLPTNGDIVVDFHRTK